MASFFNLTLDTLAPAGLSITLNDGAQYATSATVTAKISVTDAATTGYQMKIWGTKAAAKEADASWETFAATKSITLNTSIPAVTITGPDKSRISKVTGYDAAAFSFVCDVDFEEYTVRVVPATSSLHTAGTQIPTTGGSTNVSGTAGGYKKNTAINVTVKGADLEAASSGDGVKIVKVFVKNAAGTWSAA